MFGDARRIVDPRCPFADRPKEGRKIDLLEPLAPLHAARDIADEQNHRLRILMRDMHPDAGIGRARAAGNKGDAGPPGHAPVGAGHEAGAAFLTAGHHVDFGPLRQGIEHGEEAFPRHREDPLAPLLGQTIDQQRGGALHGIRHVTLSRFCVPASTTGRAAAQTGALHKAIGERLSLGVTGLAGAVSKGKESVNTQA